jgi:carboxyl-terminal processing protease
LNKRILTILFAVAAAASSLGVAYSFSGEGAGRLFHMIGDPYPRITEQVFSYVESRYVVADRAGPRQLVEGVFRALETRFPPVMVNPEGDGKNHVVVYVGGRTKRVSTAGADTMNGAADVAEEVLSFVAEELKDTAKKDDVYYVGLNGAVAELDPHSNVINPKQFKEFMIGTRGSFGGIGFVFGIRDGNMSIITPIEGTPAERGGLRSGDRILFIDGEPTINMPVDVAANKMRGDPGTQVTITIERTGWTEPRDFTFTREVIHVDSVDSYVLKGDGQSPVVYAKVKNFQKDTTEELRKAIREAEGKNPDLAGIVLDLRNNPGGLLDQAIELSDGFMEKGVIVSTRGRNEEDSSRAEAVEDEPISRKPLVLLINQGSASASEIVSGALRSQRALIIGSKTFGKGSVQKLFPLPDRGALKLTVAQYLTANDVSIQSIGIQPDIFLYRASADRKNPRVGEPPEHSLEADLKNAFTDWGNASEKPWRQVQYVDEGADDGMMGEEEGMAEMDEEEGAEPRPPVKSFAELTPEEKLARLGGDFHIKMARRVLGNVPASKRNGAGREALFAAAGPVVDEVRREEAKKLTELLAKIGVDWSEGETVKPGTLAVKVDPEFRLTAAETGKFTVSVKNLDDKPAYRIWGRSESADGLLRARDFLFGKVNPGEEKSWTVEIKAPKSLASRWDPVTVKLMSGEVKDVAEGAGGALARAGEPPRYGFTYDMTDVNDTDPKLSHNGLLDKGDRVDLTLHLVNLGAGTSTSAEVNIRGEGDQKIYLKSARQKLDNVKPKEKRDAKMSFVYEAPSEDGETKIVVTVSDKDFGVGLADELKFRAGQPYPAREDRFPPQVKLSHPPPLRTTADKVQVEVEIEDDSAVKEFYSYLGDKKIFYERAPAGGKRFIVKVPVSLEPGENFLVLSAADDRDIVASRTFHIYRAETGQEMARSDRAFDAPLESR